MAVTEAQDDYNSLNYVARSIDMIRHFGEGISEAKSEEDVFSILEQKVEDLEPNISCLILKVDKDSQLFSTRERVLKNGVSSKVANEIVADYYQPILQQKESLLVKDIKQDFPDKYKDVQISTLFLVPLKMDGEIFAITAFLHSTIGYFIEVKCKFYEVVSYNASNVLAKIYQGRSYKEKEELTDKLLSQKELDLETSIETIAEQYSELKHQQEKQEALLQEVYHRVSNNLQIISSILRLYLNNDDSTSISKHSFREVYDRVQVMALVHQNIYKNMGTTHNGLSVEAFSRDLCRFISDISKDVNIYMSPATTVNHLPHDVLVSVSLLITEICYFFIRQARNQCVSDLKTELVISKSVDCSSHYVSIIEDGTLTMKEEDTILNQTKEVNYVLITALADQISAEIEHNYTTKNEVKISFDL